MEKRFRLLWTGGLVFSALLGIILFRWFPVTAKSNSFPPDFVSNPSLINPSLVSHGPSMLNSEKKGNGNSHSGLNIGAIPLWEIEKDLYKEAGNEPHAQKLLSLIVVGNHFNELGDTTHAQLEMIQELRSEPEASFAALEKLLGGKALKDSKLAPARASLVILASQLGDPENTSYRSRAYEIALKELTRDTSLESGGLNLEDVSIASQSVLFEMAQSPESALDGTIQGIIAQVNPKIRYRLAHELTNHFPELEGVLKSRLAEKDIWID
jgi:hypothetical protein